MTDSEVWGGGGVNFTVQSKTQATVILQYAVSENSRFFNLTPSQFTSKTKLNGQDCWDCFGCCLSWARRAARGASQLSRIAHALFVVTGWFWAGALIAIFTHLFTYPDNLGTNSRYFPVNKPELFKKMPNYVNISLNVNCSKLLLILNCSGVWIPIFDETFS